MLNHLANHQTTQLDAETKNQIFIFLEFWVVFAVSSYVGNTVQRPRKFIKFKVLTSC